MANEPEDEIVFHSPAEVIAFVGMRDAGQVSLGKFVEALNVAADELQDFTTKVSNGNKKRRQRVKDALRDFDPDDDLYLDMD